MNTIDPRVAHSPLSRRAKFDVAMLVSMGVASTVFFLLPVWTSFDSSRGSAVPSLAATPPAVEPQITMTPARAVDTPPPVRTTRPRVAVHRPRAPRPAPEFVQAKVDVRPAQSRLSRFFLGDGSERVQPFPLADRRADR